MNIVPPSIDLVKVGYISKTEGYIPGLTIDEANEHEKSFPGTKYVFVDGDANIRYLTIEQVNQLTIASSEKTPICDTSSKPCGPPTIVFFGGGGIGAKANPIVDRNGNLLAVDIVDGGYGYTSPPVVKVLDPCDNGSGAVLRPRMRNGRVDDVIVIDSGRGYLPPGQTVPQYPARICIKEILVTNPGLNYNCGVDELVVTPDNGARLTYNCDSFGRIRSVNIVTRGCYSELPTITMRSNTGVNASFVPLFSVTRDPEVPEEIPEATGVVQVFDLVGLTRQGYVDGTEYYGNVFFEAGIKYAGLKNTGIRVYETRAQSIGAAPVEVTTTPDTDVVDTFVSETTTTPTTVDTTITSTTTSAPPPTPAAPAAPAATPTPPPPPPAAAPPPPPPPPPTPPSYGGY